MLVSLQKTANTRSIISITRTYLEDIIKLANRQIMGFFI